MSSTNTQRLPVDSKKKDHHMLTKIIFSSWKLLTESWIATTHYETLEEIERSLHTVSQQKSTLKEA